MENFQGALDPVFHALADPTRRAVLQQLGRGPATVSTLAQPFDMGLPAFLKHVGILSDAGLVTTTKAGRVRTCHLNEARLTQAEGWFRDQRDLWKARHDQLDTLLQTLKGTRDAP